ncbi:MAG: hypothetical protein KDJ90_23410 [Nitratireductor sp.]|nr:hypothetical protein [Nitratireductor sp.]
MDRKAVRTHQDAGRKNASERLERLRENNVAWGRKRAGKSEGSGVWKRQSWTLPREEARAKAREFLRTYPKAAYASEVESWRVLPGDLIEFTMRRLPSAD